MLAAAEINAQHALVKEGGVLAAARIPHAGRKSGSTADRHVIETALVSRLRAQTLDLSFAHDVVHRIKDADAVRRLCQVRKHFDTLPQRSILEHDRCHFALWSAVMLSSTATSGQNCEVDAS